PRATNYLRRLNIESATSLANQIDEVVRRGQKRGNIDVADLEKALKGLSKAEREAVDKYMNKRESAQNIPDRLKNIAAQVAHIMDRSMNEASKLGVMRRIGRQKFTLKGSGKAFPQIPNADGRAFLQEARDKGLSSPRVLMVA